MGAGRMVAGRIVSAMRPVSNKCDRLSPVVVLNDDGEP